LPNLFVGTIRAVAPSNTLVLSSSDTIVAADSDMIGLVLTNISSSTMYLGLNGFYAVLNKGIVLSPNGGVWTMDDYNFTNDKISGIANTTNSIIAIQKFTR